MGQSESVYRRRSDNTLANKDDDVSYKTIHEHLQKAI